MDDTFKCSLCEYTANSELTLKEHSASNHKMSNKRKIEITSPSSSPPSKKQECPKSNVIEGSDPEDEMTDIEIETSDFFKSLLEQRIKALEARVVDMEQQRMKDEEAKNKLVEEVKSRRMNKSKRKVLNIPNHLSSVHVNHLSKLRGYRMKHNSKANGACLENSASVHFYEIEEEGSELKKRINNHIADNWDNFYQYKIGLPYIETVGVGENAKEIKKSNKEEMIDFLRSEEYHCVQQHSGAFSNSQYVQYQN